SSLAAQIFKSTDGGANWAGASVGLTNPIVRAFAFDPATSSVFAGTVGGGVFRSIDGGATWQPSGNALVPLPAQLTVTVVPSSNIFASPATLLYTMTVSNVGQAVASNVSATLTLPSAMTFVSCTTSIGTCSAAQNVVTATVGTLNPNGSAIVQITAAV